MDSNDILNIQEAYMDVYSNSTDQYDLIEDFEMWVESLVNEGYNLSNYTWDDMYGFYLDEAAVNWDTGKTKRGTSPRKKTENKFVQYMVSTNPRDKKRAEQLALVHQNMTDAIKKTGQRRVGKAGPIASARFRNAAIRQRGGKQPSLPIKTVPGLRDANSEVKKEQVNLYDLVLSHLLDEGYAYNEEAATAIMANMSEEWVDSIVEVHGAWTRQGQSIHDYSSYAQEIGHDDPETRRELRNLTRRKGHGPKIAAHARNKANFDIERAAGRNPRTPEYRSQRRKTTS